MTRLPVSDGAVVVVGLGYVGRRFAATAREHTVVGLSRTAVDIDVPAATMDLDADGTLPLDLPEHFSVLYTVPPAKDFDDDVRLARLLEQLLPAPRCFVYISTSGVYGDRDGERVDESSELCPSSDRASRRVAAETLLTAWAERHASRLCCLRTPGIYGPGRLGIQRIRKGMPMLREADASPGNRIHVDDLLRCCSAALSNEAFSGPCNVGDGDDRSSTWFTLSVAEQCGLPPPPLVSRAEAEQSFSASRLSFLNDSRRVDTRRMRSELGVTPRYANAESGIRASLAEERARQRD